MKSANMDLFKKGGISTSYARNFRRKMAHVTMSAEKNQSLLRPDNRAAGHRASFRNRGSAPGLRESVASFPARSHCSARCLLSYTPLVCAAPAKDSHTTLHAESAL